MQSPRTKPHDPVRLSPRDAGLLDLERRRGLPLHVALVLVFDGETPSLAEFIDHAHASAAAVRL